MDALIRVREALERLLGTVSPLPDEEVLAARGLGRVLAEEVYADRDFPPTDRSAMDGYALRGTLLAARTLD